MIDKAIKAGDLKESAGDESILNDVVKYFGTSSAPEENEAMFILPDGNFMFTTISPNIEDDETYDDIDVPMISQHDNVDEFLIQKGYASRTDRKPWDETIFQSLYNVIRFQITDEYVRYLTLPSTAPNTAQYSAIEQVLDLASSWVGEIEINSGERKNSKIYSFDEYTVDDIIKRIRRYYSSGTLYENFDEQALQKLDDLFGQAEPYMWSTYILPNGHFLNPSNNEEYFYQRDLDIEYEHSDFMVDNGEDVFENCIKMNVTYPYVALPKDRWTIQQQRAFESVVELENYFIYEHSDIDERMGGSQKGIFDMEKPLMVTGPFGDKVFDLSVYNARDIIKEINKAYVRGTFDFI